MTEVGRAAEPSGGRWIYLYALAAPSAGTNNVVISASSAIDILAMSVSYTGVGQSGQPDANATNTAGSGTTFITSITTVSDNVWTVIVVRNSGGAAFAGPGPLSA